ncbi:MAG: hypothetical protein ACI309_04485 [Candidatus Limisoma sp.]
MAVWENVYKVEIVEFERDIFSGRLIEKEDTKEFTASDDIAAAEEGFIWYLANIKTFCKINESSNGNWISIPKFYSVYDEDGHLIPRIKGDAKQNLIKTALSDEDIQAYKENLPPYHFEYSALMCD